MLQALQRFSSLIDALAKAGPGGLALGELAGQCALPPATCTRALKAMAALGWADQAGNRGRYRLGPRATALTAAAAYQGPLLARAEPLLRAFVRRHPGVGAALVALRDGRRFGLWSHDPSRGEALELFAHHDLWSMPSGRLLVALLPPRQRRRCCDQAGLPTPAQWPGIATSVELAAALAAIRRERCAQVVRDGTTYTALPVDDGAGGTVTLGCWQPSTRVEARVLAALRRCAGRLNPSRSGS
jgi:DNA-binding IclR family transcriptional regulator